ncbi:MAG: glycosyltransferase family 2 protein, partial [Microbacteriaceae bacterium]|nr:glycosyltransferase family 2 protein [Microbacteriaceae bacterium]
MATETKLKASLGRTSESLERLQTSRKKLERRFMGLENRLVDIRDALKTGRGQRIRGEISRAVRTSTLILEDLELLTLRAERLDFKARNLQLDAQYGLSSGHVQQHLIGEAQQIRNTARGYIDRYDEWMKITAERGRELKQYSINAEWHYKIDLCIDAFRAGYDELGLTNLLTLVYGPNTPGDHRRRALGELLSWGHTVQDQGLIALATSHVKAYQVPLDRYSPSDRELLLRIEGYRQLHSFDHEDGLLLLLEAIKRGTEDAFLAAANWAAGASIDQVPGFGRKLQIDWINRALAVRKLEPIYLNPQLSDSPFDQVDCDIEPGTEVNTGPLVSVIIPAWNSEQWLPTTIRGLQKQSWKNIEIIIVDDCSSDNTLEVARGLAATDSRIKVLANHTNRGAYASRNFALEISAGVYITVHDADDWSHPRKIERQVNHLVQNPDIVANLSQSVRIEPDNLMFFAQYGREIMRQNSSSVLFARTTVFKTIGYWDEVKFGADTEFHHRIRSAFGPETAPVAKVGMLSLTRYHSESLTGGGKQSTQRGIVGARRDYVRKFEDWHAKGKLEETSLYLERSVVDRPFPIPVSSSGDETGEAIFDVLVLANLAIDTDWLLSVYRATKKLSTSGKKVAFLHLPGLQRPTQQPSETFEKLLADTDAIRIYTE